ncbi:MAG: type II toxin-antitoxin system HicB family antitoxin [Treponema sp.]|uniref:type II toxin-antitoxin system HicB family antitoxin n=1 Tax=Treponema sp. TaxID=166 RepID=UPI003FA241CE
MKYTYTAVFTDKNGKIYARVPDLDGCITTGSDLADAIEQMEDAMAAWLCVAEDEHLPIPESTPQHNIQHTKDDNISLIKVDTYKYRAATDTKVVRKNVSIPAWLASAAENAHLNFSQELQSALKQRLQIAL